MALGVHTSTRLNNLRFVSHRWGGNPTTGVHRLVLLKFRQSLPSDLGVRRLEGGKLLLSRLFGLSLATCVERSIGFERRSCMLEVHTVEEGGGGEESVNMTQELEERAG